MVVACVLGGILLIGILAVLIYICVTNRWVFNLHYTCMKPIRPEHVFQSALFVCNMHWLISVVRCPCQPRLLVSWPVQSSHLMTVCGCVSRREKSQDRFYSTPYPIENIQSTWSSQGIAPIPRATLASSSSNNAGDISLEMTEGAGKRNSNGLVSASPPVKICIN